MEQDPDEPIQPIEEGLPPPPSPENGGEEAPPAFVTILEAELEQLKRDASEYKDKTLRLLADIDNARKRMQKEKQELIQYSVQNIVADFLQPIDHLENALKFTDQMTGEVKNWAMGFQMILTQFKDVLAANGVTPFESVGKPFDPHCHEAVEVIHTSEYPPDTVVSESVRGYKMGDKVIRPARVKVAKAAAAKEEQKSQKQE